MYLSERKFSSRVFQVKLIPQLVPLQLYGDALVSPRSHLCWFKVKTPGNDDPI